MHRDTKQALRKPPAWLILKFGEVSRNELIGTSDHVTVSYHHAGTKLNRTIALNGSAHRSWIEPVAPRHESYDDWDRLTLGKYQTQPVARPTRFGIRYVDLFAGCGGMSLGIEQAALAAGGVARCALANDINASVLEIYGHNIQSDHLLPGDVTEIALPPPSDLGQVDLLIGGPPCQGHSNLNNYTRRNDDRNRLYFEMVRFALDYDVPVLVIENVPTVMRSRVEVVDQSVAALQFGGYQIESLYINSLELGIPQTRRRHFLIASKEGMPPIHDFIDAFRTEPRTVEWAIGDLLDIEPTDRINVPSNLAEVNRHRISEMFKNGWYEMPNHLRPPSHQNGQYSYTAVYGRLRWDQPAGTITTHFRTPGCGRFIHPLRERTLTMHEAARLQTFPDSFEFFPPHATLSNQTVQTAIGNAVPPKLAFVMGLWAIAALGEPSAGLSAVDAHTNGHADNGYPKNVLDHQPHHQHLPA